MAATDTKPVCRYCHGEKFITVHVMGNEVKQPCPGCGGSGNEGLRTK